MVKAVGHRLIQYVNTEYSVDELPLDPKLTAVLQALKKKSREPDFSSVAKSPAERTILHRSSWP